MGRVNVRDGFWVLLAALWCVDEDNLIPLFLTAALVHEAGHAAALYLAGGRLRLDGGMALAYLSDGGFPRVRGVLAALSGATLLLCGLLCLRNDGGCWVLLTGTAICISALRMKKCSGICVF